MGWTYDTPLKVGKPTPISRGVVGVFAPSRNVKTMGNRGLHSY